MEIKTLLEEEIQRELEYLKETDIDSDLHKQVTDNIVKLTDRAIDLEKLRVDSDLKEKNRRQEKTLKIKQIDTEREVKLKQIEEDVRLREFQHDEQVQSRMDDTSYKEDQLRVDRKDRIARNLLTAASIVLPIALTIWGTRKSFEFEEKGSITTMAGRNFLNRLFSKK